MNSILYAIIMAILWIVNLLNDTGLGKAYQITELVRIIIYLVCIVLVVFGCKRHRFLVDKRNFVIFGGMVFVFVIISYIKGNGAMGLHYISTFLLVYIISKMNAYKVAVRLTGIVYVIMGMTVLYIYGYGNVLSGWNANTIGMIGLYSYLFFLISFYNVKNIRTIIAIIGVTVIYISLIGITDSRSSILFAVIAVLFSISIIPRKFIMKTNRRYYLWLLVPLFIAIGVVKISHGVYMENLNIWSLQEFKKPLFNGRDELWEEGFQVLFENILFGRGDLSGNWHNCIITVLTAYGIVGGILWVMALQQILSKGRKWINDTIVSGCIITFIVMFIQQSVELGLISENPNLLPYITLGIMLGRVKLLNKQNQKECVREQYDKNKCYYTNI